MCGIAGIIGPANGQMIKSMTDALVHRGPDDEGFFSHDGVHFGHKRLSINDLEGGRQPITSADEQLVLICNGEIYNSPVTRERYVRQGYQFKTHTDVEVILPLYQEFGEDCVKHLQGMFAFAIWDKKRATLFLARDHMGQKPLFFAFVNNQFMFASEVKAILAAQTIKPEIDLDALWHYISLRYIPDDYSLFKNIKKLKAATTLTFKQGQITSRRYWTPNFKQKATGSEEQITQELDNLLNDTVRSHLLSDVEVGAFLSGGIDSGTISALIATQTSKPLTTFSIGVQEQSFNELPYARMVAQKYHMNAREKIVQADIINLIPAMVYHLDEPSDPFAAGVYLVSGEASKEVKVVMTGDGGDENFAGYDRFAGNQLVGLYSMLPIWFRKHFMGVLINYIPESFGYKSLRQKALWFNKMSFYDDGYRYAESMSFLRFTQEAKQQLFTQAAINQVTDSDSIDKILQHFNADNVEHLVDRMLYTDLMTRMPDHLLSIVDRMTMAHSLESRAPLVDYKVVEYAATIPAGYKLKGRELKYILKKVAGNYLPDELINREKQGFGFPLARWMRTDLKPFIQNLFKESRFIELGIFNPEYINRIMQEHFAGKADHNFRLWILINLEIWYRIFFENRSVESVQEEIKQLRAERF